jgi:acyl-CoA synthetase (AMP-forming)/AMP-acid ligase II
MYGLTECKRASYLAPEELDKKPASVGKAIPNTEVFIVNEAGEKASAGETGELVVRGSHVARGYWNSPELTSQVFRPGFVPGERLLYTGDLFTHDQEGFLYYVGRKHEQIKVKGERVSPREVENVLCQMDRVLEAAVFGAADEILGQAIVACIVCADGPRPTVQEVLRFCSSRLAPLMMPKFVIMFDAMPKSSNGKIDKNMLKVLFEESKHLRHSPAAEHSRQEKSVLPLPADSDRPGENRSPGNVPEGGMPDQTSTAPCPPSSQP